MKEKERKRCKEEAISYSGSLPKEGYTSHYDIIDLLRRRRECGTFGLHDHGFNDGRAVLLPLLYAWYSYRRDVLVHSARTVTIPVSMTPKERLTRVLCCDTSSPTRRSIAEDP